jgi:hypothetical protein
VLALRSSFSSMVSFSSEARASNRSPRARPFVPAYTIFLI